MWKSVLLDIDANLDGAIARYDNPADLLSHWDGSPLAETEPAQR